MTDLAATLVLGGARSGKSAFAERLIADSGLTRIYLATATAGDDEIQSRIAHHRERRGDGWITVEEPMALVDALTREATRGRAVLVDCLTLWLSNLMLERVVFVRNRDSQWGGYLIQAACWGTGASMNDATLFGGYPRTRACAC
jgi:adenosyl cobinamide kinase/adenosyl cobinamide phosphate guanylyltransferase